MGSWFPCVRGRRLRPALKSTTLGASGSLAADGQDHMRRRARECAKWRKDCPAVKSALSKGGKLAEPVVIEAPAHQSARSRELWAAVAPKRAQSSARLAQVETALEALDRVEAARLAIERGGMLVVSGAGIGCVSPLVRVERDAMAIFARVWRDLGLGSDRPDSG